MLKHNYNNNFLSSLANQLKNSKALYEIQLKFCQEFGLTPIIGAELEFYLENNVPIELLERKLGYKFVNEEGLRQYEVNFPPQNDLTTLAQFIEEFKINLDNEVKILGFNASFHSKPLIDDYGSSLHIHINFIDKTGLNFFAQDNKLDLIASYLCYYLNETFLIFAPNTESYSRFDAKFMSPVNISYGRNNRSTAIRVPDSLPKRLEHRVAGSDCNPYLVVYAIFKAIYLGLTKSIYIPNMQIIYGNAFDKQYDLQPFPKTLEEALELFNQEF
jgi:glutamine synthetase